MKNYYEMVDDNKRKSVYIILLFVLFISTASYFLVSALGYDLSIVGIFLIGSGLYSFISYYYSDQIILSLTNARPANKIDHFHYYSVAENIASSAQIPLPKLYVLDDNSPNAFATGRDPKHGAIAVTTGLLALMDRTELEGVVAHEMGHIKNFDTRLMSLVAILVGFVVLLSDILLRSGFTGRRSSEERQSQSVFMLFGVVFALFTPLAAKLIELAVSRRREYLADATASQITKYPEGLARALEKIMHYKGPQVKTNPAFEHLYIANLNTKQKSNWLSSLFHTHPPLTDRIRALRTAN